MKTLLLRSTLVSSLLATALVLVGLSSLAEKFDPVAQQSHAASPIEVASGGTMPCLPCATGGDLPRSIGIS
jgi:hypothetical protein